MVIVSAVGIVVPLAIASCLRGEQLKGWDGTQLKTQESSLCVRPWAGRGGERE